MAEKVIFKLKEPQTKISPSKQKETLISLIYNFGYNVKDEKRKTKINYTPLRYSTGLKIKPCLWNDRPHFRAKQTNKFNYQDFNTSLNNIETAAKTVFRRLSNDKTLITPELFRKELNLELDREKRPEALNLNQFIDKFINEIESGKRLTVSGKNYAPGTIKNFKGFQAQFNNFQTDQGRKFNFDEITIDFYDKFVRFFNSKKYSPNTIGRHIKNLKIIMRIAREEDMHGNFEIDRKKFKTPRVEVKNIYLSESELQLLANTDLSDNQEWEIARDVFLIGCYTAQRFSDYSRIRKEHFKTFANGTKYIELVQKKTGERVVIPVKPELDKILQKYDYNTPQIYEQKLNRLIKDIAEDIGIDETITIDSIRGGMKTETRVQKFELIKTHTARRSGCTNMYLAGIPSLDIMKISGHKTEREFLKYINVTKEETAQNLSMHPYFKSKMKVAN